MSGGVLKVVVAGLDFHGFASEGFVIGPDGFEGWDDGVEVRRSAVARPSSHGAFDESGYLDARVVSLSGTCVADSPRKLMQYKHRLTGLLAGGQMGRVQVQRPGEVLWADCRLGAKPLFQEKGGSGQASFHLQLWCPNPRKFGDTEEFTRTNGTVDVFHRGNFDAHPTIVVRGSAANGYRINGPGGKQYKVSRALVSGIPHRIEFKDGLLRVDGALVSSGVDRADVWPVPPGQMTTFDVNVLNGGSAEATITVTDTYI